MTVGEISTVKFSNPTSMGCDALVRNQVLKILRIDSREELGHEFIHCKSCSAIQDFFGNRLDLNDASDLWDVDLVL